MKRIVRISLSILSGILLSLAWLGFPGWTLFVALLPLLYVEQFITVNKESYRSVSFWGHAFLAALVWNALTTWWIMHATLVGMLMAVIANTFFMSLVLWLGHAARRKFKNRLGYLALIIFWISFEFIHYKWDLEWPWINLGNGFSNNIKMVQWYEFTGILGGSLWVWVINILLLKQVLVFQNNSGNRIRKLKPAITAAGLILVPIVFSMFTYYNYIEKENPKNIVLLQPNVNPYDERFDSAAEQEKLDKLIRLAQSRASEQTDFIIGPETIFESSLNWDETKLPRNYHFLSLQRLTEIFPNAEVVFGATTLQFYPDKESASNTARPFQDRFYDVFNSAVFIGQSAEHQIYHKSILVNGVEKIPFMRYLGFLRKIFIDLGGASGSLGSQDEASVFTSKDGMKVAPVICYESIFGEYVSSYVNKGAEIIFIITNDGWWKNTPGYKQHMSFARLRAIETRRSIARSANTGITCFINQRGDVEEQTAWWVDAAISGKVNANDKITFYVKHGDYIGRLSVFVSVLLLLFLLTKRFSKF